MAQLKHSEQTAILAKIIAERVRTRLVELHKPNAWLSEKIGATQAEISQYTHAKKLPTAPRLAAMADSLDCSVDYLLGRESKKTA